MTIYKYPQTIADGAKILDQEYPNWAKEIDVDELGMDDTETCVLGQVCDDYLAGMEELFSLNIDSDTNIYTVDNIFGATASLEEWKKEIQLRCRLTFAEALELMKQGKYVSRPGFPVGNLYGKFTCKDGKLINGTGSHTSFCDAFFNDDWFEVK